MKKQIAAVLTAAAILSSFTACSPSVTTQSQPENQSSAGEPDTSVPNAEASGTESDNAQTSAFENSTSGSAENEPAEEVRGIYGETEIPDIPCGDKAYEGKANDIDDREALKQCLDSMVFETHTCGEYTIRLVGRRVRTDKANFPESIYVKDIYVEVEKNGTKIDGDNDIYPGYYCNLYGPALQNTTEFRLLEDKIGDYIDIYMLETPVIAMREFFDDDPERTVKKAVDFATIQDNKIYTGFLGACDVGTGVILNLYDGPHKPSTLLLLNPEGYEICRKSIFEADEFKVIDRRTLLDTEAGIKYTFYFSDPPTGVLYNAEKVEIDPAEIIRAVYGETEIPDIPCEDADEEGRSHGRMEDECVLEGCLKSMVLETHTCGEYKISLVGKNVRTDKENFPGSIYARGLYIEVEKNGTVISDTVIPRGYCGMFTYVPQFPADYRLFEDKIGSYIDLYELDNPVIAMRYYYDDDPDRIVKKAVDFAVIRNNELCTGFLGISGKETGIVLNTNRSSNKLSTILALNSEDGEACLLSTFSADEFEVLDNKTLLDKEAGIKFTFDFLAPMGELYTTEKFRIE